MSAHTPGPWAYSKNDAYGGMRFYVAQQEGAPYTHNFSDVATLIAETVSGERVYIQEANARLIASAPDLLESCMLLLHCMSLAGWEDDNAAHMARAAIAKATKETP